MLLTLITFAAAILFGSWIFGTTFSKSRDRKNLSSYPTLATKRISLYSLIYLLFFYQLPSSEPSQECFGRFWYNH